MLTRNTKNLLLLVYFVSKHRLIKNLSFEDQNLIKEDQLVITYDLYNTTTILSHFPQFLIRCNFHKYDPYKQRRWAPCKEDT